MTKVAAITGASNGIGFETAKYFVTKGWTVFNLSRRPSGLDGVIDLKVDVTKPEEVVAAFAEIRKAGPLDLLINNAGYGISGAAEYTKLEEARRQFEVNFFGVLTCIQAGLPLLKERAGRIINISSAAAIFPIPFQSFYSASKAAVNSLSLALANEIKTFNVSVCCLQLGDTKTGFTAARAKSASGDDTYSGAISRSVGIMEKDELKGMSPQKIAVFIYKTSGRRRVKPLYTVGAQYKILAFLNKILPNSLVNTIIGKMYVK